jgi:hypothetical protein
MCLKSEIVFVAEVVGAGNLTHRLTLRVAPPALLAFYKQGSTSSAGGVMITLENPS